MTLALIIIVVVLALVVAGGIAYAIQQRRRRELRGRFAGEYDRTVHRAGSVRAGERELVAREKHHEQLDLRPLPRQRAQQYAARWEAAQTTFVDEPVAALADADELIQGVMMERGYPVAEFDQRVEELSVEHADVLQHYRAAHEISTAAERDQADTEQMRRAMVHYRALFEALLDETPRQRSRETNSTGGQQ